jgi:AcrR family transcriptional regulator/DNA-binding XRE family transcriptional regulator
MSTETPASLGARIRGARRASGLTLDQLSGRLGLSSATLSLVERDRVGVTSQRLAAIAEVLGTTSAALEAGSGAEAADAGEEVDGGTRALVMRAAVKCIVQWGYHGTSMRQIAQTGEVSVAGVYHYFDSKQAILAAISSYTMVKLLRQMEVTSARCAGEDPVIRFHALVKTMALFHIEERDIAFIGASERRSLEEPAASQSLKRRRRAQSMLDVEAGLAAARGQFRTPHVKFAGRVVSNMCTSLAQWVKPGQGLSAEKAAEQVADYAIEVMRGPRV